MEKIASLTESKIGNQQVCLSPRVTHGEFSGKPRIPQHAAWESLIYWNLIMFCFKYNAFKNNFVLFSKYCLYFISLIHGSCKLSLIFLKKKLYGEVGGSRPLFPHEDSKWTIINGLKHLYEGSRYQLKSCSFFFIPKRIYIVAENHKKKTTYIYLSQVLPISSNLTCKWI